MPGISPVPLSKNTPVNRSHLQREVLLRGRMQMAPGLEFRTHSEAVQGRRVVVQGRKIQVMAMVSVNCVFSGSGDGSGAGSWFAGLECRIIPMGLKVEEHGQQQTFLLGRT